jgi:AcrR family transcriptional regulator
MMLMTKRGPALREHILWKAKEVFLENGFERTSMDEVARRAGTSKRSLYAHFHDKETLFLAVVELVRGLFLDRLKTPGDYSHVPAEALTLFCGRYLEHALFEGAIRMCRVSMAEAERFPNGAANYFDVVYTQVHARLDEYLRKTFHLSHRAGGEAADRLLGRVLFPRFIRALFGVEGFRRDIHPVAPAPDLDIKPIRRAVKELLDDLAK